VVTSDDAALRAHVSRGGNVGLVCGPAPSASGVAVLDFDDAGAAAEMMSALGRLPPTVRTGSGKGHVYVRWEDGLPAKIRWHGVVVGEVQRGGANRLQHVVMPPSVHPCGEPYRWLLDPRLEPPALPAEWRAHLSAPNLGGGDASPLSLPVPAFVAPGDSRGTEGAVEPWDGPDAATLVARALKQRGAVMRASGYVKFQCLGCDREGRDRHFDNAYLRVADGRWGCAVDRAHRRAIAEQLGVM
jgi:hypothetical protein